MSSPWAKHPSHVHKGPARLSFKALTYESSLVQVLGSESSNGENRRMHVSTPDVLKE